MKNLLGACGKGSMCKPGTTENSYTQINTHRRLTKIQGNNLSLFLLFRLFSFFRSPLFLLSLLHLSLLLTSDGLSMSHCIKHQLVHKSEVWPFLQHRHGNDRAVLSFYYSFIYLTCEIWQREKQTKIINNQALANQCLYLLRTFPYMSMQLTLIGADQYGSSAWVCLLYFIPSYTLQQSILKFRKWAWLWSFGSTSGNVKSIFGFKTNQQVLCLRVLEYLVNPYVLFSLDLTYCKKN